MESRNIRVDSSLKKIKPYNLFKKHILSEEFVSVHTVSKNLLIDNKKIVSHIKKSKKKEQRWRPEVWYSDNNYFKFDLHQHITWLNDYIRDTCSTEIDEDLVLTSNHISGIYLEKNESIGSHNHIDEWDYQNSPDISVIYCADTGKDKCDIIFEHEYGRHKKRRWAVFLEKGKCVIFPSYINFFITQNINEKPFVGLSYRYQLSKKS